MTGKTPATKPMPKRKLDRFQEESHGHLNIHSTPLTAEASQALADRLRLLEHNVEGFKYVEFAMAAGVEFGSMANGETSYRQRLSRWINNAGINAHLLGRDNYIKIVTHLAAQFPALRNLIELPVIDILFNPIYHSLAGALGCNNHKDVIDYYLKMVVGSYKVYRPSIMQNNHSFVGRLDIAYDDRSGAFSTRERYKMDKDYQWDMSGTLFPMGEKLFMTVAVDPHDKTIQAKYFNNIRSVPRQMADKTLRISGFSGYVSDLNGSQYYMTRIYGIAIENSDKVELEYKPNNGLPNNVQAFFGEELHSTKNAFILHD